MTEHFNKLTPAEAERLAMLAEECGEVIQIVCKILRHGMHYTHPVSGKTNARLLSEELCDVQTVAAQLRSDGVPEFSLDDMFKAWKKKLKWAHHHEPNP